MQVEVEVAVLEGLKNSQFEDANGGARVTAVSTVSAWHLYCHFRDSTKQQHSSMSSISNFFMLIGFRPIGSDCRSQKPYLTDMSMIYNARADITTVSRYL